LMAAAAETDVVLQGICAAVQPGFRGRSIRTYYDVVNRTCPGLFDTLVAIDRYGLSLQPWQGWTPTTPPLWWTANNKVKHNRGQRFSDANLKNCLNAVAGLFVAVLYLYKQQAEAGALSPAP